MNKLRNWKRGHMLAGSVVLVVVVAGAITAWATIGSTGNDFFLGGTQPLQLQEPLLDSTNCIICHGFSDPENIEVANNWQGSMMGQAARDPLFYACLAVANQDAAFAGDLCIRCHSPGAWLSGRSDPPDASAFTTEDRDGVNCMFCHRMVDPIYKPGISPVEDLDILNNLADPPVNPTSGNYVIDPIIRIRGPFDIPGAADTMGWPVLISPFHQTSELCATCHDVSNPMYQRVGEDYVLTTLDLEHPTGDKYDMFPIERTYSEWLESDYPDGVDTDGRFGGDVLLGVVSTCQDCHMPTRDGKACIQPPDEFPPRPDMPRHDFAGGNTWIRDAIPDLYPQDMLGNGGTLTKEVLDAGQQRSIDMLQLAATIEAMQDNSLLDVRVINETGHKLPTGYPEGRRMWLNVQFLNDQDQVIAEAGAYNVLAAELSTHNTKVYETKLGIDEAVSALTGIPAGVTFHFVLNNKIMKDNRIPPRGFTNAAYAAIQAAPVGATYADGQYWDDTGYAMPFGTASMVVRLYYQTSSKEYIEFLRDENTTNDAGQVLYDAWLQHGRSAPVIMTTVEVDNVAPFAVGDSTGDGMTDLDDHVDFADCLSGPGGGLLAPECAVFDFNWDSDVTLDDFGVMQIELGL